MEITNPDYTIVQLIAEFGFAIIAVIGLAYFIYYIWNFISERIDPKIRRNAICNLLELSIRLECSIKI